MDSSGLKARDLASATVFYLVAAALLSFPLVFHPSHLGRLDNADAQLNAWALSWISHQLPQHPFRLFDGNTFFPLPMSLAFSEHLVVPGILAMPILWLSDDLVLTFNAVLILGMLLSALGMFVLVWDLTRCRSAAILSGLFFSFATYRFVRLPHIQLQIYGFLPLTLFSLHRYFREGRERWAFAAAVFFLLQALSGTYLGAMTALAVSLAVPVLAVTAKDRGRRCRGLILPAALTAAVLYPFVRPYLWVHRVLGVEWDLGGIGSMSATPMSYLASGSRIYSGLVGSLLPREAVTDFLFPGLTLVILGALGACLLAARRGGFRDPRTILLCYTAILVAGFAVSLGPRTPFYRFLYEYVVFFRGLRALSRFGLVPLLSLSVLSGYGMAWMWKRLGSPRRRYGAAGLALLFIGETTVVPLSLTPFQDDPPEVYTWLREEAEPGPIVELPFKRIDTRYMFWARHHGFRPMLNGDSGFIPQSHVWMREALLRFPSPDCLALFRSLNVRYVVVHLGAYRRNNRRLIRLLNDLERYKGRLPTVASFGRCLVLRVTETKTDSAPPLPVVPIEPMEIHTDTAGSTTTIEVRFRRTVELTGLRLHYGRTPRVPVIGARLSAPDQSGRWKRAWKSAEDWAALTDLILSLLQDPSDGRQTLRFEPLAADVFRIELEGYDGAPEITELELLGDETP